VIFFRLSFECRDSTRKEATISFKIPTNTLFQCLPNYFARGTLLASKNNQEISHTYSFKLEYPDDRNAKLRTATSELISDRYE
jgi:hypothetical protein